MKLIFLTKKYLRQERAILEGLINRYGDTTLFDAHDRVSVELDYFRGDGSKQEKPVDIRNNNENMKEV